MTNDKPSMSQSLARVVLCESGRKWATVLRRQLAETRLYEVRSDDAILEELAASPFSFIIRETTPANAASAIKLVDQVRRDFPQAVLVAVGGNELQAYQTVLWEAGFAWVCASLRSTSPIIRMVRRQLAAAPTAPLSIRETVFSNMPWNRFASD